MLSEGDAGKASTASAVAEAKKEMGFVEPPSVLDASIGRASESQDDDSPPSAEDLARISEDPQKKALYRRLVRESNQTGERLAARQRQGEEELSVVNAIRDDPRAAARILAQASGMRVTYEDETTAADRATAHLAKTIGQEAAEAIGPAIMASVEILTGEMMAPINREREERQVAENRAKLQTEVQTFASSITEGGGDYDESVEREMAQLVRQAPPGPQATAQGYMKMLYNEVMARRGAGKRPARGAAPGGIKPGMNPREAVRIAVASARRDLGR